MSSDRGARGGRGDRGGRGRGGRRGGRRRGGRRGDDKANWRPVTKLGRLVKAGKINSLEEIYKFSLPIKEYNIIDQFLPAPQLKEEVMKVMPVQKQTRAGQRTRFKAFVCVGDNECHLGLGVKCAKEVATAIRGAIIAAKLAIVPVRKGYWGSRYGKPHTVPFKVTGKCGSVSVRLIPAPRGTGIVAAVASKKILHFAGFEDVYTSSTGTTRTMGNFVKATYQACLKTYAFLTPDLWPDTSADVPMIPYQQWSDELASGKATEKNKSVEYEFEEELKPSVQVPATAQAAAPQAAAQQQPALVPQQVAAAPVAAVQPQAVPQQQAFDPQQQVIPQQQIYQTPQVDPFQQQQLAQ